MTQGCPHKSGNPLQSVFRHIGNGITVWIPCVPSHPRNIHGAVLIEQRGVIEMNRTSLLTIGGAILACHHNIPGVPADLVMPWIVIRLWRDKSAAMRSESMDDPPFFPYPVDHFHGAHMVYPGIESHFTKEGEAFRPGIFVKLHNFGTHVRCTKEMLFVCETYPCNIRMKGRGQ